MDEETTILPDGTRVEQPPLFSVPSPGRGQRDALEPPPIAPFPGELSARSSLGLALAWFEGEMVRLGYAPNTRANYSKGVRRFVRFVGGSCCLQDVKPGDVKRFQAWLQEQRRADKTKELTLTGVRTFFRVLVEAGVLQLNPADGVYPAKARSPLPDVLYQAESEDLHRLAANKATRAEDPDPLPALLLILFLDMGLRLGEATALEVSDVDVSNPLRPVVHVRYPQKRHRAKQRSLAGPPDLATVFRRYLAQHPPGEPRLLPWTGRHLQNVTSGLGEEARTQHKVTPNVLRWTYALEQWKAGVPEEQLQARLGLSKLGWQDAKKKLQALSRRPV
jgi:site-specific recombinase XerD